MLFVNIHSLRIPYPLHFDHWEGVTSREETVGDAILKAEDKIRKLQEELKNLEPTIRPIQSAISDLEATIRDLETEQQSVDQADNSLDTKISENIALLITQYEKLTDITKEIASIANSITSATNLIVAEIQLAIVVNRNRPRPIIAHPLHPVPQTKEMTELGKQFVPMLFLNLIDTNLPTPSFSTPPYHYPSIVGNSPSNEGDDR